MNYRCVGIVIKSLLFAIFILQLLPLSAQTFSNGYDSLPFPKPKLRKMLYEAPHPQLKEVALRNVEIKYRTIKPGEVWKDVLGETLSGLFGGFVPFGSTQDVIWELKGNLACNNEYFNWTVLLFCTGTMEKEREHVTESDGSKSVVTTETGHLDWDKGAIGLILERGDTIGRFRIIMDPGSSPSLKPWSDEIYSQTTSPVHTDSKNKWYRDALNRSSIDYAITGLFRNQDFILITNGNTRKSWFYLEKDLTCVFRRDIDDLPVKAPDRIAPYLLLEKSIPESEQPDWYRMAVVSRFLCIQLSRRSVEW